MQRLYYLDSYQRLFDTKVQSVEGGNVYLEASAFYPSSGGQPADRGTIGDLSILDVTEMDDGRVAHRVEGELRAGAVVTCTIDWRRRFDHMQQHTGQHLLSAVFEELFQYSTLSFHMGGDVSTIDIETSVLAPEEAEWAERRANEIVAENRPVTVSLEDAATVEGLRKPSGRTGELRVVTIADLDRSACGGTHVRATGEIGSILMRKTEKIRGSTRLEFVCGLRAVRRARHDFNALSAVARSLSAGIDDVPSVAAAQAGKLQESEKVRRRVANELAQAQGKVLYEAAVAGPDGVKRYVYRGEITEEIRTQAQSFTAFPKSVYLAVCAEPATVLLASSKDSGVNAGAIMKQAVNRGGGSPQMAQGSAASPEALATAEERIIAGWPKESI